MQEEMCEGGERLDSKDNLHNKINGPDVKQVTVLFLGKQFRFS